MAIEFNDQYSNYPIQTDYSDSSRTQGTEEEDRTYEVNTYPDNPDLTNIKSVSQIFGEIFEELGLTDQDISDLGLDLLLQPEPDSESEDTGNDYLLDDESTNPPLDDQESDSQSKPESKPESKPQENSYSDSGATDNPEEVSDGVIGDFDQNTSSKVGDCWLLSAIVSTNNTPEGKQLIKDSIEDNGDGTYSVTFAGDPNGKTYTVTQKDLQNLNSEGDIDVAILEEAARQYYEETEGEDLLQTGALDEGLELLTGLKVDAHDASNDADSLKEQLIEYGRAYDAADGDGPVMMFGTDTWMQSDGTLKENKANSKTDGNGHMLSITEINEDKNTISYVDPYDASSVITQDLDDFAETQSKVVWSPKGLATQIYTAPGQLNVHPKIETLANDMTASEADKALADVDFTLDSNGEISDMDLYSVVHNIDGSYSDEQRAAAYRILQSRS